MTEMIMLVGLPGAAKSFWANNFVRDNPMYKIHSSDALRQELLGNVNDQGNNTKAFEILHKRIIEDLKAGISVIYDATNLNKKRRIGFLRTLPKYVMTRCVLFLTPVETCIQNDSNRERQVGEKVILNMRKKFCPPHWHEGFHLIEAVQMEIKDYIELLKLTKGFDQENSHHSLSLYDHLKRTWELAQSGSDNLQIAATYHDIGKLYTKSRVKYNGESDGECHYYSHNNVGAYEFLTAVPLDIQDALYVANLIYYHMHPYISWEQSKKSKNRDKILLGETMFNDILKLHEFDKAAH